MTGDRKCINVYPNSRCRRLGFPPQAGTSSQPVRKGLTLDELHDQEEHPINIDFSIRPGGKSEGGAEALGAYPLRPEK